MGYRRDHSVPQSKTDGHPDLDLWLQASYGHTCTLQVRLKCWIVILSIHFSIFTWVTGNSKLICHIHRRENQNHNANVLCSTRAAKTLLHENHITSQNQKRQCRERPMLLKLEHVSHLLIEVLLSYAQWLHYFVSLPTVSAVIKILIHILT